MTNPADKLALSTVWAQPHQPAGAPPLEAAPWAAHILDQVAATGLRYLELEYRLPAAVLTILRRELAARELAVVSLHNFIPLPPGLAEGSGDAYNLAAPEQAERRLAVDLTCRSLELASDMEVGALVVHLGWVAGLEDKLVLRQAAKGGDPQELAGHLARRGEASPGAVDLASRSLDRLAARAEALGVRIGLENRFHPFQVPDFDEMGLLLERFRGAPLGFWCDLGHARAQTNADSDLPGIRRWLSAYGQELVGCHLHDTKGVQDHLPPGRGDLDWDVVAPLVKDSPRLVLELRSGPEPAEVADSAALVREALAKAAG
ncbi:MAG: sugar phosphate isomerase/epimerase [Deltaproteobacteria bacterium]|nr:sugar phosphate isomerase/epimerase [Deltaproteobacteria bacterium]